VIAGLLLLTPGTLLCENVVRSDPETEGEKRLLNWDLHKTFDLSQNGPMSRGKSPTRSFSTQPFAAKNFSGRQFQTSAFTSPEFLVQEGKTKPKGFTTKPAGSTDAPGSNKTFSAGKPPVSPPKATASEVGSPYGSGQSFREANRLFQGPEAARKEQKFSPENAPKGGVIEGRRLSVEEVKEILNKSK
jgi:hypothetical protein